MWQPFLEGLELLRIYINAVGAVSPVPTTSGYAAGDSKQVVATCNPDKPEITPASLSIEESILESQWVVGLLLG